MTTPGIPDLQHTPGTVVAPEPDEVDPGAEGNRRPFAAQIVRRRFLRHKGAMISMFVLIFVSGAVGDQHRGRPDPGLVAVDAVRPAAAVEPAG